ncbi:malonate transporter subunit MadL [Halomonas dongshanensis]|uniref:Malonate transporter subunit MadL n=1 Tax=Halomonas dongshanensis TaxID=2890835 RepID=A0ABT2EAS1_9GAMM|nr:malonate transporter subunit MadL [Halomonas dongshanensis]MCS2608195.1 malonate transporter subunit MadL [Halomonas dongshanensis]
MVIYGVALLAGCMLVGLWAGDVLGMLLGVESNVGGVGIAMLMLIFLGGYLMDKKKMPPSTESGITFWNGMYIPIVVAMAASQNVAAAFDGGMIALLASLVAVVASFALVPFLNRLGRKSDATQPTPETPPTKPAVSKEPSAQAARSRGTLVSAPSRSPTRHAR